MKLFECQFCGQPLYFENTFCESCGHRLGFSPPLQTLSAVDWANGVWTALAYPSRSFRFCANAEYDVCNWLVAAARYHKIGHDAATIETVFVDLFLDAFRA